MSGMWKRLSLKFKRPPSKVSPQGLPLGLSQEQVQAIRSLTSSPHWRHWEQALECLWASEAEAVAGGRLPYEDYLFQSGVLQAIRRIAMLPETLAQAEERRRDRTTDTRHPDPERGSIFYGTDFFRPGTGT